MRKSIMNKFNEVYSKIIMEMNEQIPEGEVKEKD